MPTVFIPTPMRKATENQATLETDVGTLGDVLKHLNERYPALSKQLLDGDGAVKGYINVFVNGDEIRTLDGLNTNLAPRDEVFIVPAMAGG